MCVCLYIHTHTHIYTHIYTHTSFTFVLGQAVGRISGKAIYILDNDGNSGTFAQGGEETDKEQARNSGKERSQD